MPGSPTIITQLPIVLPRPLPAPHQHGDLLVATDERRKMTLSGATPAAACSHDPVQRHRLRQPLKFMVAALLGHEQAGDLALHSRGDYHRARLC
jgi:hypothetical protein